MCCICYVWHASDFSSHLCLYFSSCCLSVCASGKRRLPKRLIYLVEGRIKQKRLLWYDLWRRQSIDVWSWVWWKRASSFIPVPCQILDLNSFHQKEFLAGRNWAYIQVWSPDFCLHWVTVKMTLTPPTASHLSSQMARWVCRPFLKTFIRQYVNVPCPRMLIATFRNAYGERVFLLWVPFCLLLITFKNLVSVPIIF